MVTTSDFERGGSVAKKLAIHSLQFIGGLLSWTWKP
jgi:hypothetical protein